MRDSATTPASAYLRQLSLREYTNNREAARRWKIQPIESDGHRDVWLKYPSALQGLLSSGVWGCRNLESLVSAEQYYVLCGFRPSRLHLVHQLLLQECRQWVSLGATPLVILGAYQQLLQNGKQYSDNPLEEQVLFTVMEQLGAANREILTISDVLDRRWAACESEVSQHITIKRIRQLLGWSDDISIAQFRTAVVMVTSILLPQLLSAKGLVAIFPCALIEAPFVELAGQVAGRLGLLAPVATYRRLIPSLDGKGRMSEARPHGAAFLNESPAQQLAKWLKAPTAGRPSSEHGVLGGDPYSCVFLQSASSMLPEKISDEAATECQAGLLCRECKSRRSQHLVKALTGSD